MKKIVKSIFAITITAFLLTSCEDEQDLLFVSNVADFKILSPQSNDGVVLSPLTPSNPGLSMTWEDMNYLTPTAVTYRVEIDKAGDNFDTPINVTETSNTFITITSNELNTQAVAAGLTAFVPGTLEIRIRATIGSPQSAEKFSNVITYNVTTFSTALPRIYVVGNFLMDSGYGSNWTPANAVPLIASAPSETDYEGYVYFNTANFEYKFLPTNTSFDGDFGLGSASGILATNAGNITGTTAGYYFVKADTAALTYSTNPAEWSVTGNATALGWPAGEGVAGQDHDMVYNPTSKKWSITLPLIGGNKIKFRANDRWTLNYGSTVADGSTLNEGGENINVPSSGNYLIELDLSAPRDYKYAITLQ